MFTVTVIVLGKFNRYIYDDLIIVDNLTFLPSKLSKYFDTFNPDQISFTIYKKGNKLTKLSARNKDILYHLIQNLIENENRVKNKRFL